MNQGQGRGQGVEIGVDSAADQVGDDLAAALIGDVLEIGHARRLHKELGGHVRDVAGSCGPIRHWGFAGLGIAQEIFQRLCRQLGVHDQNQRRIAHLGYRGEVPQRIVRQLGREGGADGLRRRDTEQQRVAVGGSPRDLGRGDGAVGAGLVVDDHAGVQRLAQALRDLPGHEVRATTGRKADDQPDRPVGVRRRGGRRGGA
ncbi:hypothetical protein D3C85_1320680 [compost metagenome]